MIQMDMKDAFYQLSFLMLLLQIPFKFPISSIS